MNMLRLYGISLLLLGVCSVHVLHAVKVDVNVSPFEGRGPAGTDQAFNDGELFYHAIPVTPGVGNAVKIITTDKDTDYICRTFVLTNRGIVRELNVILRATVMKEGGSVNSYINRETGVESLHITAPIYQFPYIEEAIRIYDVPGTRSAGSGTRRINYEPRHRLASEFEDILRNTLAGRYANIVIDDKINTIHIEDAPSAVDRIERWLPTFDIPRKMVRVEAQIVEIELDDNFNFGLALEAWKEGLPENVDMTLDWSAEKANPGDGPTAWARYVAQNVQFSGMRPKAVANFINYLVRTGKAEVLSSPTIVAMNGEVATIASLDNIAYKAYSTPQDTLDKQAQTGVSLKIRPVIGTDSTTLEVEAFVNSVVGWSGGGTPIVNTRNTSANVILNDGEVFTLSGLRKDVMTHADEGVPFLRNIPLVGMAFSRKIDVKKTSEIIVFLTPHRVTPEKGITERERELLEDIVSRAGEEKTWTEAFTERVLRQ